MTTQKYTPHIIALSAIFTLGNAVILAPTQSIINLILSLVLLFFISFLLNWTQKSKAVYLCTALLVCVLAVVGAVFGLLDYISFLKTEQSPHTNIFLLAVVFIAVLIMFVKSEIQTIYKYCLFTFAIIIAVVLVCFVGGIKFFDYRNFDIKQFEFSLSIKEFLRLFSSIAILPLCIKNENKSAKPIFCGVTLGFSLLLITALQAKFTLEAYGDISYPYLKAVSVISSGSLFTRLDGLVWFLFFVTALIKIAICIKVLKNCNYILQKCNNS